MTELTPIRDKIERAFRNKERLHLDVGQVERLVRSPIWPMLAELTAQEIAASWQEEQPAAPPLRETITQSGLSLAHSGSGIVPSATNGASVGTIPEDLRESVGRAASRRASEAVEETKRLGRRKRR